PQFPDVLETSYWLEFTDENTDVIRSPVAGDQYHRYYWTNPTDGPHYNSFVRIGNGSSPLKLGVPAPTSFPGVAPSKGVIDPVAAAAAAAAAAANPVLTTTWT